MRGAKIKFDKNLVVSKSKDYIDKFGIHEVSIRNLAKFIGCSTQPIFRLYKNSEELMKDVYQAIEEFYESFVSEISNQIEIPFLGLGVGYINFAKAHPNLFYAMFMGSYFEKTNLLDFFQNEESDTVVLQMPQSIGLSKENCRVLLRDIWLLTHGIATMIYTKQVQYNDQEIKEILYQGFYGFIAILMEKEND